MEVSIPPKDTDQIVVEKAGLVNHSDTLTDQRIQSVFNGRFVVGWIVDHVLNDSLKFLYELS